MFRYKFQEVEPGVDLIPNLGLWTALPGLVKVILSSSSNFFKPQISPNQSCYLHFLFYFILFYFILLYYTLLFI